MRVKLTRHGDRLIGASRAVVWAGRLANWVFLAAVGAGLGLSWMFAGAFAEMLRPGATTGVRLLMVVGVVMGVATDRLLFALGGMVATAQAGDPFVAINARRLQTIGWCLLVLQLLDIPTALLSRFIPALGDAAAGDVSLGGWMAVLLVFVLARVWQAGAAMRDELAGTV